MVPLAVAAAARQGRSFVVELRVSMPLYGDVVVCRQSSGPWAVRRVKGEKKTYILTPEDE